MQKLLGFPSFKELRKTHGMSWECWQERTELSPLVPTLCCVPFSKLLKEPASACKTVGWEAGMQDYLHTLVYSFLLPGKSPKTNSLMLILERKQSLKISEDSREGRSGRKQKEAELFWLLFPLLAWVNLYSIGILPYQKNTALCVGLGAERPGWDLELAWLRGCWTLRMCHVAGTLLAGCWGCAEGETDSCSWFWNHGASPMLSTRWDQSSSFLCCVMWCRVEDRHEWSTEMIRTGNTF